MKCTETEKLIGYACRLIDESSVAEVRAHLEVCSLCRGVVEQHQRLHGVLDEWKVAEPTPRFDARVRAAVDAHQAERYGWKFWNWEWTRGLALAALGVMIVAGVAWFGRYHRGVSRSSQVATRQPQHVDAAQISRTIVNPQASSVAFPAKAESVQRLPELDSASSTASDDKVAQAMDDYDLAANFDLLSEIPKGEPRVAN